MTALKVLIVGAGIGGLSLAQVLKNKGIAFEIFDRDESETSRRQGYAIGINKVADELQAAVGKDMPSIYETNHLLPLTLPAQIVFTGSRSPGRQGVKSEAAHPVLRASRHRLRAWLARDIDIQYNKAAVRVEEAGDQVTVYFKDGTHATGDVLVGADGTKSAVRKHLTEIEPTLVMTASVMAEVTLYGEEVKRQLEIGHSAYVVDENDHVGRSKRLFVGLDVICEDGQSAKYYWIMHLPVDSTEDESYIWAHNSTPEKLLQGVRDRFSDIEPRLRELLDKTKLEDMRTPGLQFHCLQIDRLPNSRVTLLGDAAHAMPPFRGEGGVHAIRDALKLADALGSIQDGSDTKDLLNVLDGYQVEMLHRGRAAALASTTAFSGKPSDGPPKIAWEIEATTQPLSTVEFPIKIGA